jgi:hypothetical protein
MGTFPSFHPVTERGLVYKIQHVKTLELLCWYLHHVVVGELEFPNNPESYATGSLATGRVTLGGQVEG